MEVEIAIGIAGLALTIVGGGYKLWSGRRAPKFDMKFNWIDQSGSDQLRFYVLNTGHRRSVVREIRFGTDATPPSEGWLKQEAVLNRLPLTLEPDGSCPAFVVELNPLDPREFDRRLILGEITQCFLEDQDHKIHVFKVPPRW